jgi:hypothetical protein
MFDMCFLPLLLAGSTGTAIAVTGAPSKTVTLQGTTPIQVRFNLEARGQGSAKLGFSAMSRSSGDALEVPLSSLPQQGYITIGSSYVLTWFLELS